MSSRITTALESIGVHGRTEATVVKQNLTLGPLPFTGRLEVYLRPPDYRAYVVARAIRYDGRITIPELFTCDGLSSPRVGWFWLPPIGRYLPAAILHDYLYATGGLGGTYTRLECDRMFLKELGRAGIPYITRHFIYLAVRARGRQHFKHPA